MTLENPFIFNRKNTSTHENGGFFQPVMLVFRGVNPHLQAIKRPNPMEGGPTTRILRGLTINHGYSPLNQVLGMILQVDYRGTAAQSFQTCSAWEFLTDRRTGNPTVVLLGKVVGI